MELIEHKKSNPNENTVSPPPLKSKLFVFDDLSYAKPYESVFDIVFANKVEDFDAKYAESDVVLFTGGSDVGPHLYKEAKGQKTVCYPARDKFEWLLVNRAIKDGKKLLGVCRGAQFLCVASGGTLVQHVTGHSMDHAITDIWGNELVMTSTHHQMMRHMSAEDHVLIAWTKTPKSSCYEDAHGRNWYKPYAYIEPEIVWFPKTKAMCIQGHPEMSSNKKLHDYCCNIIRKFMFGDAVEVTYPKAV